MRVRTFVPSDAAALASLFHASVREGGGRFYSPEQVAAWSPAPPDPEAYLARALRHDLFVAVDDRDEPIGYADLAPDGYIDHLYCRPDRIGSGVGAMLYAALETAAIAKGIATLHVDASEGARSLFRRGGFTIDARQDFAIGGVPIHNHRMSKVIAARP